MKLLIVVIVMGVIAYGVFTPRLSEVGKPTAADKTVEASVRSGSPAAGPAPVMPLVPVAPVVPTVHVTSLTAVRGMVIGVSADGAVIDCNVKATLSPYSMAQYHVGATDGAMASANLAKLAMQQAERETFGNLQEVGEDGKRRNATASPQGRASGQVVLAGVPLKVGETVNMVAAPIGKANGWPAYTARFRLMGGAWMFSRRGAPDRGNPLDAGPHR